MPARPKAADWDPMGRVRRERQPNPPNVRVRCTSGFRFARSAFPPRPQRVHVVLRLLFRRQHLELECSKDSTMTKQMGGNGTWFSENTSIEMAFGPCYLCPRSSKIMAMFG